MGFLFGIGKSKQAGLKRVLRRPIALTMAVTSVLSIWLLLSQLHWYWYRAHPRLGSARGLLDSGQGTSASDHRAGQAPDQEGMLPADSDGVPDFQAGAALENRIPAEPRHRAGSNHSNDTVTHAGGNGGGINSSRHWRVLCWVLTTPGNLDNRSRLIKLTWARRCDITLFMSSRANATFPTVGLNTGDGGKKFQAQKAVRAWSYIHKYYLDKADFFYKADDDTYAIIENLRLYLSTKNPEDPEYYGHRFYLKGARTTYMSGGSGLVLTRRALELFVRERRRNPSCIPDGAGEDWKTARCMNLAGARAVDTRDEFGRERFMPFTVGTHLEGKYPAWYYQYDIDGAVKGHKCCSYYPISFHYMRGSNFLMMEYLLYRTRVYGLAQKDTPEVDYINGRKANTSDVSATSVSR